MSDKETTHSIDGSLELANKPPVSAGEIVIGTLVGVSTEGKALVQLPENITTETLTAITTVGIHPKHIGRQLALAFANGNITRPIIMGFIQSPLHSLLESNLVNQDPQSILDQLLDTEVTQSPFNIDTTGQPSENLLQQDISVDGKRIVIEGQHEIVLKCGDASITLTKAGKILIRGKYLSNRSSGVNRIMGGSVQVN
jgi:hypothetical protein